MCRRRCTGVKSQAQDRAKAACTPSSPSRECPGVFKLRMPQMQMPKAACRWRAGEGGARLWARGLTQAHGGAQCNPLALRAPHQSKQQASGQAIPAGAVFVRRHACLLACSPECRDCVQERATSWEEEEALKRSRRAALDGRSLGACNFARGSPLVSLGFDVSIH